MKILVVDDDPGVLRLLGLTFRMEGFEVATASNGLDALVAVGIEQPDVLTVDLDMPVMDGRTFHHELRREGFQMPVVIVSGQGAAEACRELNTAAWVAKPFDPANLVTAVQEVLVQAGK